MRGLHARACGWQGPAAAFLPDRSAAMEPSPPSPPSAPTSSCSSSSSSWNYSALRASLQKYGRTGVIVYLSLSTCVTAGACSRWSRHSAFSLETGRGGEEGWQCSSGNYPPLLPR